MSRRWIIPLAALVLLTPVGAVALDRGASGLGVQASLQGCGVSGERILCHISASFDRVEGGEFYTASVTRPDSTVQDFGQVATGEEGRATADLWIPYAGNGSYTVEITAWGRDANGDPEELTSESTKSNSDDESTPNREPNGSGDDTKGSQEPGSPGPAAPGEVDEPAVLPECDTGAVDPAETPPPAPAGEGEGTAIEPGVGAEGDPAGDEAVPPGDGESGEPANESGGVPSPGTDVPLTPSAPASPAAPATPSAPAPEAAPLSDCTEPAA